MRLIFAGTPEFAVPALAALIDAGHDVVLVLTQPDRPAGRGMKMQASPVKQLALTRNIPVFQPETLKQMPEQARLAAVKADAMIVAAYGLILPQAVLDMPRYGCFNIHASLLPHWRGAAPIQRALLAGDTETGVTIMRVVAALDAGPMIMRAILPIIECDTAQTLHDGLAKLGAHAMLETLRLLQQGPLDEESQQEAQVTYATKLNKSEALIDWRHTATALSRQIRAFNPFPVAQSTMNGESWRIWMAQALAQSHTAPAGTVIERRDDRLVVACGTGALAITELQKPGGKRMSAHAFLAGNPITEGARFDLEVAMQDSALL